MTAIMPRFGFDLRQADLPPRWEGLVEFDQPSQNSAHRQFRVGKAWTDPWGKALTVVVSAAILAVFGFLAGAGFGFW
jgi:hypothetical protein